MVSVMINMKTIEIQMQSRRKALGKERKSELESFEVKNTRSWLHVYSLDSWSEIGNMLITVPIYGSDDENDGLEEVRWHWKWWIMKMMIKWVTIYNDDDDDWQWIWRIWMF